MSKQSEAKKSQGYREEPACCKNCANYRSDIQQIPASTWVPAHKIEKGRRCGIGGFAVRALGVCNLFVPAAE